MCGGQLLTKSSEKLFSSDIEAIDRKYNGMHMLTPEYFGAIVTKIGEAKRFTEPAKPMTESDL